MNKFKLASAAALAVALFGVGHAASASERVSGSVPNGMATQDAPAIVSHAPDDLYIKVVIIIRT